VAAAQALRTKLDQAYTEARTQLHFNSMNGQSSSGSGRSSVSGVRSSLTGGMSDNTHLLRQQLPGWQQQLQDLLGQVDLVTYQEEVMGFNVGNWDILTELRTTWVELVAVLDQCKAPSSKAASADPGVAGQGGDAASVS
jgi:FtsZ-binding cell division protein ZapB